MRYLGLDVGAKNIGVAVGEAIGSELTTLNAPKNYNFYTPTGLEFAVSELKKIISEQEADAIVIGLPVNEQGEPTEESKKIEKFSSAIADALSIEVFHVDETLTSYMADEMLEAQGLSLPQRKERVHQLSAELILEQYLEDAR